MLEISLRARLDAIGADTRLGDVEIDLHDPPFAPDRLDQEGEPHFGHLADVTRPAAALPQKDILRGLLADGRSAAQLLALGVALDRLFDRSEEHTSELQSLMRISYAVFCLKKKKQ